MMKPSEWAFCLAAALLAAFALDAVPIFARGLSVSLLVAFPVLSIIQARLLMTTDLSRLARLPLYFSTMATLWLLAILALLAAQHGNFPVASIGFDRITLSAFAGWTAFVLAAALLLYALTRYFRVAESPALVHLLPRSWKDRLVFVFVAITAGVTEEIVFRGFLITALSLVLPNLWLAALVSATVFGLLHAYQGWLGIGRTALLGLVLAVPFIWTSSIMPGIAAHTIIDLVGGLWLGRERSATFSHCAKPK